MATQFINFVPSRVQAPQYSVTLDGTVYSLIVEWVLFAQRYYIRLNSLDSETIIFAALVGSPIGLAINSISWANGKVTVTTDSDHFLRIGQTIDLTISVCVPDAYNGSVQAFVTGRRSLTYLLQTNPGLATLLGSVQQNIDLAQGMFTSKLVYREPNQQFEVIG